MIFTHRYHEKNRIFRHTTYFYVSFTRQMEHKGKQERGEEIRNTGGEGRRWKLRTTDSRTIAVGCC